MKKCEACGERYIWRHHCLSLRPAPGPAVVKTAYADTDVHSVMEPVTMSIPDGIYDSPVTKFEGFGLSGDNVSVSSGCSSYSVSSSLDSGSTCCDSGSSGCGGGE